MTIAICLKVGDGLILGADSASTLLGPGGAAANVYFTADKILNLYCGLPVGMATYGLGGLKNQSIMRLARDLRAQMSQKDSPHYVDPGDYTIEKIVGHVTRFFWAEHYAPAFGGEDTGPRMGFIVGGYSAGTSAPEVWQLDMEGKVLVGPTQIYSETDSDGLLWEGVGEPLIRLIRGWAPALKEQLLATGIDQDFVQGLDAVAPLWHPAMPIMDAIELVKYLADVAHGFVRFAPGAQTVAPPIDVAAITRHEGFRWVQRKHYYDPVYNPPEKYTKPPMGGT